jgi:hypothetical protein
VGGLAKCPSGSERAFEVSSALFGGGSAEGGAVERYMIGFQGAVSVDHPVRRMSNQE